MNKFNPFENLLTYMKRDFTTFDMSNFHQTSCKFGRLQPIRVDSVLPSDYWKGSTSLAIKVAPMIAPAFTRIRAIVNSFYVAYPQVWKYWNQFISNRPSDSYLNSVNSSKYSGRYVEPSIPTHFLQLICKIYKGYCPLSRKNIGGTYYLIVATKDITLTNSAFGYLYSVTDGLRKYSGIPSGSAVHDDWFGSDTATSYIVLGQEDDILAKSNGWYDSYSFFIHLCKEVYENLQSFGIPSDQLASTPFNLLSYDVVNALPFFSYSKIWQDYIRNPQIQGSELDFSESNGVLTRPISYNAGGLTPIPEQYFPAKFGGWNLRIADLPPSTIPSSTTPYVNFNTAVSGDQIQYTGVIALLTGYGLKDYIRNNVSANYDVVQLPQYYNGLLLPKYRNFENDIFTSAAVDPMQGSTSLAVPSTIEELRSQSKLEEFLERNTAARNFYDFLKSHWGTHADSVSNQRCKLLGTQIVNVNISEQLQTSQTTSGVNGSPLGERAGVAEGFGNAYTISNNFNEHGVIITLLSFVIDNQYFQGLPEIFEHHKDYLSYPWPEFANLGLESIPSSSLFYGQSQSNFYLTLGDLSVKDSNGVDINSVEPSSLSNEIFGYSPRYSRWKCKLDQLSGEFVNSLDFWNTFRLFNSKPKLCHNFISYENAVFISNLDRIFANSDELADKFYVDSYNDYSVSRCLPLVANPTLD